MSSLDLSVIADVYMRHHKLRRDEDFWAWEQVHELRGLELRWEMIQLLLTRADTKKDLAYVAAGPLEDWLFAHGHEALDIFETAAKKDVRLQLALSYVYMDETEPVFERWQALVASTASAMPTDWTPFKRRERRLIDK